MENGYQLPSSVSKDKVAEMGWGRGWEEAGLYAWKVFGAQGYLTTKGTKLGVRGCHWAMACGMSGPQLVALLRGLSEGEDSGGEADWKGVSATLREACCNPSIQKTPAGRSSVKGHL